MGLFSSISISFVFQFFPSEEKQAKEKREYCQKKKKKKSFLNRMRHVFFGQCFPAWPWKGLDAIDGTLPRRFDKLFDVSTIPEDRLCLTD